MKHIIYSAFTILFVTAVTATGSGEEDNTVKKAPGSYLGSCTNVQIVGTELRASCRRRNGAWHRTSLGDFNICKTDIHNNNGDLQCDHRFDAPGGSYRRSCYRISVETNGSHHGLVADCVNNSGALNHSGISAVEACTSEISNRDGTLFCGQQTSGVRSADGCVKWSGPCSGFTFGVVHVCVQPGTWGGGSFCENVMGGWQRAYVKQCPNPKDSSEGTEMCWQ